MAYLSDGKLERLFQVSTSKNSPSCIEHSYGTPTGLHAIADCIGADSPAGTVFKARVSTGRHFSEFSEDEQRKNLITSRILRLRGLEAGINSGPGIDSYDRYIYIHGTNHEARIGQPFSGGCIELSNADVIELFELVQSGDQIWIV